MFWHLKNRIKEETGSDVDLIPSKVKTNTTKPAGAGQSYSGPVNSLGSFTKEDGIIFDMTLTEEKEFKNLDLKEDEWRKKLQKKEEEMVQKLKKLEVTLKKQLDDKDREMKEELEKKERERRLLEDERNELKLKNSELEEMCKKAIDYQKKICQYQEDIDQLQGFQTQEVAKIKHLLLVKEQEIAEKDLQLRENNALLKSLKLETARLRSYEQQYEDMQDTVASLRHGFDLERAQLTSKLAKRDEDVRHLKDKLLLLEERANSIPIGEMTVDERVQKLLGERALFERRLEEAHLHLSQIKSSWSGKIESLETQVGRLCRQASEESSEKRQVERERDHFKAKIAELEEELERNENEKRSAINKSKELELEKLSLEEEIKNLKIANDDKVKFLNEKLVSKKNATEDELKVKLKLAENDEETREKNELIRSLELKLTERMEEKILIERQLERLTEELDALKKISSEVSCSLEKERHEKDEMMIRNAEVSQEMALVKQALRKQEAETNELQLKMAELDKKLKDTERDLECAAKDKSELSAKLKRLEKLEEDHERAFSIQKNLKAKVLQLENDLFNKNKSLKVLQQRLTDMKKTLQKELKVPAAVVDHPGGPDSEAGVPSSSTTPPLSIFSLKAEDTYEDVCDDVSFAYLKHVIMKFLTSRECEAQHLIRAVATLLRFSAEEEKLLKETLQWKMSWFGTRPDLGNGQTAKAIPPR